MQREFRFAFYVHVRPNARRTRIVGPHGPNTWKMEVAAPPERDRANREIERFLCRLLDLRPDELRVAPASRRSRKKAIEIAADRLAIARSRLAAHVPQKSAQTRHA